MSDPARDPDQHHLDETVADEPLGAEEAPQAGAPASRPAPPARKSAKDLDILGETVTDTRPDRARFGEVDLTRVFDRLTQVEDSPLGRYDPEAGRTNVAVKFSHTTEAVAAAVKGAVSGALFTPFGKLLLSIAVGLVAIALVIGAAVWKEQWMVVAAVGVAPIALVLVYWRYQAWLGHKRYIYRLLETLGEDVSGFGPDQAYRRTRTRGAPKKRR